jgi:flagellar protein FlgJ
MAGAGGASTSPATPAVGAVAAPTAATPNSSAAPVSGSSAGTPRQSSNAEARARFVQQVEPLLGDAARQLGVSPRVLLAQAALETGWGSAMPGNNLFGVKAGSDWSGATVSASTQESTPSGSSRQTDRFRAYPSIEAAVADYAKLVAGHSRYDAARGAGDDAQAYGAALARGGYATDPAYAAKLAATASSAAMSDARSGAPGSLYAAGPARGSRA